MGQVITITEFRRRLSHYLDRVAVQQETLLLKRRGRVIAEVRPAKRTVTLRELPALLARLPRLSKKEAEAFARDVEEGQKWANSQPLRDPWEE